MQILHLHRSSQKPDWEQVPIKDRNVWQRIAEKTKGILTPGNVLTVVGFVVAFFGIVEMLRSHFFMAALLLILGRLLDIGDGIAADKTGTKSALGEKFDAVADKVITLVTIIAFFVAQVAPWWLLVVVIAPHIIIPIIVLSQRTRHHHVHPSYAGKISMALAWVSLAGLLLLRAASLMWPHPLVIIIYLLAIISSALGFYVAVTYGLGKSK